MGTMTSDTTRTDTKPQAKPPETFRSHLPAIIAAATGTVLAAVLGSLIGTAGTIAGMVVGSMASGTASWWAERGIRRSTELAAARAEALRAKGYHLHTGETATRADAGRTAQATRAGTTRVTAAQADPAQANAPWNAATRTSAAYGAALGADDETQLINASAIDATATDATATRADPSRSGAHGRARPRRRWVLPTSIAAVAFVTCAIVVTLIEGAAGKPLSAVVQGKAGHGTTFGGGSVSTSGRVSPSPTPSTSGTGGTTAPATGTASPGTGSPSPTGPAGFGASNSPTPTTSPSVSVTPSVTPTGTSTGQQGGH
jgi:hypothetical protein